jgi:transposase
MKQRVVYVGLDIAKAYLDLVLEKESCRFANRAAGRSQLLQWLGRKVGGPVQVICEASGGYERGVLRALQHAGVVVSLVQASRVRQFARAAGVLAKTDALDASVLAALGAALQPPPTLPPEPEQEELRELESQRRHLSLLLVGEQNRAEQLSQARLRALSKSLIAKIQKQITQIDALIKALLDQSEALGAKAKKLTAIVGVGPRTAALLLAANARTGKTQPQRSRGSGWPGSLQSRQRDAAGQTGHLWRAPRRAHRPLHGSLGGRSSQPHLKRLLSAPTCCG